MSQKELVESLDDLTPVVEGLTRINPQGLGVDDELNLYLVVNGLKSAAMITLDPFEFDDGYGIERRGNIALVHTDSDIRLKPEDILRFKSVLDSLGVAYKEKELQTWTTYSVEGGHLKSEKLLEPIEVESLLFYVGKDQESLDGLFAAKSDEEIGLSLDYPKEAVKAYGKVIGEERRDGSYAQVCLAKIKQAGVELPLWLAYLSHVPEELDLINGNVSPSSKELGEKYQTFVRNNNPELAKRVEKYFVGRRLPDRWERGPGGSYGLYFKP